VRTALRAGAVAITAAGSTSGNDLARLHQALERVASDVDGRVQHCVTRLESAVTSAVDPHHGQFATASQAAVTRLVEAGQQTANRPGRDRARDCACRRPGGHRHGAGRDHPVARGDRHRDAQRHRGRPGRCPTRCRSGRSGPAHQLSTALTQIRVDVAARTAVAQARSHSSVKGADYEADCLVTLGAVAARAGDGGATNVGTKKGHDGGLVGDLVVELSGIADPGPVLVAECKSRSGSNRLSLAEWRTELRAAMSSRQTDRQPGPVPSRVDAVPVQRLIVLNERSLIIGHDPARDGPDDPVLTAAFLLMRLTATTTRLEQHDDVDLSEAHRQLADLRHALSPIGELELEVGKIDRAGEVIRQTASTLRADLIGRIDKLQTALTT